MHPEVSDKIISLLQEISDKLDRNMQLVEKPQATPSHQVPTSNLSDKEELERYRAESLARRSGKKVYTNLGPDDEGFIAPRDSREINFYFDFSIPNAAWKIAERLGKVAREKGHIIKKCPSRGINIFSPMTIQMFMIDLEMDEDHKILSNYRKARPDMEEF